jgi:CobQ-like glutamine amidotransferase family enzyme
LALKRALTIVHLYGSEMNTYGDEGKLLVATARLRWRGLGSTVLTIGVGDPFDLRRADLVIGGGGQDRAQVPVGEDLQRRQENLHAALDDGVPMLVVCGTYQLFGHRFLTSQGQLIPGVGIFDAETVGSTERMIGNVAVTTPFGRLVGFENHSGRTRLGEGQAPLGRLVSGNGNDGVSGFEGAVTGNAFGTYLHGPVLGNPEFADALLLIALGRRFGITELEPLDDGLQQEAVRVLERRRFDRQRPRRFHLARR